MHTKLHKERERCYRVARSNSVQCKKGPSVICTLAFHKIFKYITSKQTFWEVFWPASVPVVSYVQKQVVRFLSTL